jgi:predicted nucleic acid-binding protein
LKLVIDASVAVKWLVAEPGHESAAALLLNFPTLVAPDFVAIEVANVLWKKVGRSEIRADQAEKALASLPQFFENLFPTNQFVNRALQISLELNHPIYDCLYLACAEKESARLITADARLVNKSANNSFAQRVVLMESLVNAVGPI